MTYTSFTIQTHMLVITSAYKNRLMEALNPVQLYISFLPCQHRLANTQCNASRRLRRAFSFSCTVPKWQIMRRPTARRNVDVTTAPHSRHLNGAK
jgi:hypothetical protein